MIFLPSQLSGQVQICIYNRLPAAAAVPAPSLVRNAGNKEIVSGVVAGFSSFPAAVGRKGTIAMDC